MSINAAEQCYETDKITKHASARMTHHRSNLLRWATNTRPYVSRRQLAVVLAIFVFTTGLCLPADTIRSSNGCPVNFSTFFTCSSVILHLAPITSAELQNSSDGVKTLLTECEWPNRHQFQKRNTVIIDNYVTKSVLR